MQELPMKDVSGESHVGQIPLVWYSKRLLMTVTDITREMLALIQSTTKLPLEQEQEESAEEAGKVESIAEASPIAEDKGDSAEKPTAL